MEIIFAGCIGFITVILLIEIKNLSKYSIKKIKEIMQEKKK